MGISTIKFSQFLNAGNIAPGDVTVGLNAGTNAQFNNPWAFLPPGSTAARPPITPAIYDLLRFNTDLGEYEYYNSGTSTWVQLASTATGFTWNVVTVATTQMVSNNGYIIDYTGGQASLLLPTTAAVSSNLIVVGFSSGGWTITQNAGQNIIIAPSTTTTGTSGSLTPSQPGYSIQLINVAANNTFTNYGGQGSYVLV